MKQMVEKFADVTPEIRKEPQMSYPDPYSIGNEAEIRARYRAGSFSRSPLAPHQMRERLTPTQNLFVLCHLGVPSSRRIPGR